MTPEEIRLRALEFATTAATGGLYEFDDVLRRAEACAAFIEGRVTLASGLDEAVAKIHEPWPDTITRDPGANPFKPGIIPQASPLTWEECVARYREARAIFDRQAG